MGRNWKEEIEEKYDVDMPRWENNRLYDDETGLEVEFKSAPKYRSTKVSSKASDFRKEVKKWGLKALQGVSAKQKNWAEQIRAEILRKATNQKDVDIVCTFEISKQSKFWIDNRNNDFALLLKNMNEILAMQVQYAELTGSEKYGARGKEIEIKYAKLSKEINL